MKKHAYLIEAHKVDETLITLLKMLDDKRNDIFIHMDKRNKTYSAKELKQYCKESCIYHTERIPVFWGGYSQIQAELVLLKNAVEKREYAYYHLLSGADLPIQTQNTIYNFFTANTGKEFIGFKDTKLQDKDRVERYWLFQTRKRYGFFSKINKFLVKLQCLLNIRRKNTELLEFQKGANWFSITDKLARYVISKEAWIEKNFKYSRCCDEVFLQTIVANSDFFNQIYEWNTMDDNAACMRLVDWKRGIPYIFKSKDFEEITKSELMFARKFDACVDAEIIRKIYKKYKEE